VSEADLEAYLAALLAAGLTTDTLHERVTAVRRLWSWRELLPEPDRLSKAPPWQGDDATTILGRRKRAGENRTPRIPPATMDRLLLWSLRFVDCFADDILAVRDEYVELAGRTFRERHRREAGHYGRSPAVFEKEVAALVERLRELGAGLPGKPGLDGGHVVDRQHLVRLLNAPTHRLKRPAVRRLLETSGLAVADAAYLHAPVRALLDRVPWRSRPISFAEAERLMMHLSTACFVVIAYLSGMRPGEALTLRRECVSHDAATGLRLLHGKKWKGAVDESGAKRVAGEDPAVGAAVRGRRRRGRPVRRLPTGRRGAQPLDRRRRVR
jgi:integrase